MLMSALKNGKGISLTHSHVKQLYTLINKLVKEGQHQYEMLLWNADMLDAYRNEYGDELMEALIASEVEAELVEETGTPGQAGEGDGLDPSEEE